jgi:hypothetical protein
VEVVEEEAEGEAVALGPALISRKAIALVERAAASHMKAAKLPEEVVEVEVTVEAMEAAAEEEVEEVACATTSNVVTAPGVLLVAFHTKKELLLLVVVVVVSAEEGVAEAVDGVDRKIRIVLLAEPQALLLVFATTFKKDGVLANLVDSLMKKERQQHLEVVAAVAVVVVEAVAKEGLEAFVSPGRKENARVVMIAALPMLKIGF